MDSHRDIVVFLYRALRCCIRKQNLHHPWAAIAIEDYKRLCGEQALRNIHQLESQEGTFINLTRRIRHGCGVPIDHLWKRYQFSEQLKPPNSFVDLHHVHPVQSHDVP